MEEYLRGLRDAYAATEKAGMMSFTFSAQAEIRALIEAEEKRLAPLRRRIERNKAALAPRKF